MTCPERDRKMLADIAACPDGVSLAGLFGGCPPVWAADSIHRLEQRGLIECVNPCKPPPRVLRVTDLGRRVLAGEDVTDGTRREGGKAGPAARKPRLGGGRQVFRKGR